MNSTNKRANKIYRRLNAEKLKLATHHYEEPSRAGIILSIKGDFPRANCIEISRQSKDFRNRMVELRFHPSSEAVISALLRTDLGI